MESSWLVKRGNEYLSESRRLGEAHIVIWTRSIAYAIKLPKTKACVVASKIKNAQPVAWT